MLKIALGFLVSVASACASPSVVLISESEHPALIETTAEAIEFWNDHLGYEAFYLEITPHGDISNPPGTYRVVGQEEIGGSDVLGVAYRRLSRNFLVIKTVDAEGVDYTSFDNFFGTVAHEFGHSLGLRHVSDERNLMYSYSTGQIRLTRQQINKARRRHQMRIYKDVHVFFLGY